VALQVLVAVNKFIAAGQAKAGASVSLTVTRKEQVLVNPAPSVALHVTVLIPLWKVAMLLLPLAVGAVPPLIQTGCPVGKPQLSVPFGVG
jgi:hypothetical protein